MRPVAVSARKWTLLSVHPNVRELLDSDDYHFTGYEGVRLSLVYPREYYKVIGTFELPLRVVSPGDWVIDRSDGSSISLSEEGMLKHYPDILMAALDGRAQQ